MFLIIAIEDFILLYLFFALINCSVGAYLQHNNQIDDTDYEDASYFSWFMLWWIFLPRQVWKWIKSIF
jgi:hypothetical protein